MPVQFALTWSCYLVAMGLNELKDIVKILDPYLEKKEGQ